MMMEEVKERRQAEVDFVEAAYDNSEAWIENSHLHRDVTVCRKLELQHEDDCVVIHLRLTMPQYYPIKAALEVGASVDNAGTPNCDPRILKNAHDQLPHLIKECRQTAIECMGDEAVFIVLSRADEWIQDEWPKLCTIEPHKEKKSEAEQHNSKDESPMLGRRLIYSHHIISKIKRGDIKKLASQYNLTGYMKVGWPGLLIVEGHETDCISFYDEIRPWAWQYLVVRGEQQERIQSNQSVDGLRRFDKFQEVESMSVVAEHCREVGLETLFRTSMKVYDNVENDESEVEDSSWHGALIHVDHMNNGKAYRKWLRKASQELDCFLAIKEYYYDADYSKRPKIFVAVVGTSGTVSGFLKKWRTSRVDVDSKGKPCLERMMSVIVQEELSSGMESAIDWSDAMSEAKLHTAREDLLELMSSIGNESWQNAVFSVIGNS